MNENTIVVKLWLLAICLLACVHLAEAQQPKKVHRIGFLTNTVAPFHEAFRQRLLELGYIDGHNLMIETRTADGKLDRLPGLATELAQLGVDVIVAAGH